MITQIVIVFPNRKKVIVSYDIIYLVLPKTRFKYDSIQWQLVTDHRKSSQLQLAFSPLNLS